MGTNYDYLFKLLIIGDAAVGKSSLMMRFADNTFTHQHNYTVGVDFKIKTIKMNDRTVKLQIWDTVGQERFRTLTSSLYRGAQGVIMVYDTTDETTFHNLKLWAEQLDINTEGPQNRLLIANKCDLTTKKFVDRNIAIQWAQSMGMKFLETSAKNSVNVETAFTTITRDIMARVGPPRSRNEMIDSFKIGQFESESSVWYCCYGNWIESTTCDHTIRIQKKTISIIWFLIFTEII